MSLRYQRLTESISAALAYDRSRGIHAVQAGLLNAMDAWARADADAETVGPAVDAVLAALVRLEVALDGGREVQDRCPDKSQFNVESSE
jgi:hypothetical protein